MPNRRIRVVTASFPIQQTTSSSSLNGPRLASRSSLRGARRGRRERAANTSAVLSRVASRVRTDRRGRSRHQEAEERAELLALVAHELRTPLTSVMGYTEVLLCLDAGELNEQQVQMLERVTVGGERLLDLIEGLLEVVGDERNLRMGYIDVAQMIEQVGGEPVGAGRLRPSA